MKRPVRGEPYVLHDVDGREVTVAQGKAIVAERYFVDEEVRRRRRTRKKVGKAPQKVLVARSRSHPEVDSEATFPCAQQPPAGTSRQAASAGGLTTVPE